MSSIDGVRRRQFADVWVNKAIAEANVQHFVLPDRLKDDAEALREIGIPAPVSWNVPAERHDLGWKTATKSQDTDLVFVFCPKCREEDRLKIDSMPFAEAMKAPRRCDVQLSPTTYRDSGSGWDYIVYVGQCANCLTIYHAQVERRMEHR